MTPYCQSDLLAALSEALTVADARGGRFGICFVDDGGRVLLSLRQPAATVAAADSAQSKARTAVWLGDDTGSIAPTAPIIPALTAGVAWPLAVFAGGLVLRAEDRIVGAVGVGGSVNPDNDVAVAQAAKDLLTGMLNRA